MIFVDILKINLSFIYVKFLVFCLSFMVGFGGFRSPVRAECIDEGSSIICNQAVLTTGLKAEDEELSLRLAQGSYLSTFNQRSYGFQAINSQTNLTLDQASTLTTMGSYADGVHIEGGQTTLEFYGESSLSTFGAQANGISIEDAEASILLDGSIVQTSGDKASGISADNSVVEAIIAGASHIHVRGQNAHGIDGVHRVRIEGGSSVISENGTALIGLEDSVTITETGEAGQTPSTMIDPDDSFWIGGTVTGGNGIALDAGGGDDQVTIDGTTANVSGLVIGGAGDDQLILEGSGTLSDQYVEFEQVELADGSNWTLESGQVADYERTLLRDSQLEIDGTWAGDIILDDAGANLSGSGQLDGTLINRAGVFAFRTDEWSGLTLAGSFQQEEGGTLIIQTGSGKADLLTFSGSAELGGTLRVEAADSLAIGSTYPLLLAKGGISGAFDVIEKPARFLEFIPSISDEGTLYQVLLTRQPLAENLSGLSARTAYMAGQLDQIFTQGSLGDIDQSLENMSDTGINDYLETQSGIIALEATATAPVMMAATNDVVTSRLARTDSLTQIASDRQNSSSESGFATGDAFVSFMRLSWWIEGTYGLGSQDGSPDARGYDYTLYGTVSGVETPDLLANTLSGLFVSWASSDSTVNPDEAGASDSGQTRLYQLGCYGRYLGYASLEVSGTFSVAYLDIETARSTITGTALGQTRGLSALMTGELSSPAQWAIGHWQLGPFVGFESDYTRVDPYSETGAGSSNLSIEQEALHGFKSLVGLMVSQRGEGILRAERIDLKIALAQTILSDPSQAQVNFLAAPDVIYTTQGAEPDQHSLKVGFDLGFDLMESMGAVTGSGQMSAAPATTPQAYLGYNGQFSQNTEDHRFTGGIKFTW